MLKQLRFKVSDQHLSDHSTYSSKKGSRPQYSCTFTKRETYFRCSLGKDTHQNKARLSDVLYSKEKFAKHETIYLNCLDEVVGKEVYPCTSGSSAHETSK